MAPQERREPQNKTERRFPNRQEERDFRDGLELLIRQSKVREISESDGFWLVGQWLKDREEINRLKEELKVRKITTGQNNWLNITQEKETRRRRGLEGMIKRGVRVTEWEFEWLKYDRKREKLEEEAKQASSGSSKSEGKDDGLNWQYSPGISDSHQYASWQAHGASLEYKEKKDKPDQDTVPENWDDEG